MRPPRASTSASAGSGRIAVKSDAGISNWLAFFSPENVRRSTSTKTSADATFGGVLRAATHSGSQSIWRAILGWSWMSSATVFSGSIGPRCKVRDAHVMAVIFSAALSPFAATNPTSKFHGSPIGGVWMRNAGAALGTVWRVKGSARTGATDSLCTLRIKAVVRS